MKKLIITLASALASLTAFAELDYSNPYWIVKDGKMSDNVTYVEYDAEDLGTKVPSEMKDTVVDGENVVVYKQVSQHYLDVRLKFDSKNQLDLSKNYMMVLEYKIPASHAEAKLIEGNKPLFFFGFSETEASLSKKNCTASEAYCTVDAKWGKTDEWVTVQKYIFSSSSTTTLEGMIVSYAREYLEGDMSEFPYIKNLSFVSIKGEKPFYAENFDGIGLGEFYYESNDISALYGEGGTNANEVSFLGGISPVITEDYFYFADDNAVPALTAFRDFRKDTEKDQDGSGFIDCELLHALQVETIRDSIVFPGIKIPANTEKIYSQMLIKKHKNEKHIWKDAKYDDVANDDVPILVRFNTGETVDLAKDTIKLVWTAMNGEVDVPEGATSFDLVFKPAKVGYLVDNIIFSAQKVTDVKVDQVNADAFEVVAYVDENGDIVVVNGEIVAVYNIDGRTASKNDKAVVVVVKNEKGQLASKVMLRK